MPPDIPAPRPRPAIARMHPYEWEPPSASIARQAGLPESAVVRFDTNTFPWPGATVDRVPGQPINEYPDTGYTELTQAIARYAGVGPDRITVGAGADEVLDMIARSFIGESDPVVLSRPTYPMCTVLTEMAGGTLVAVPTVDLKLDRRAYLEQARHARLTWLCNPNNPTGELLPIEFVEELATAAAAGVVAVDEAYFELSGVSAVSLIERFANLVLVRTFSKAFGLAGARVGFALAGPAISSVLRRVRPPGSIGGLSAALAVQALSDVDAMRERVGRIAAERARLTRELTALGFEVEPSAGNFVLVRTGPKAASLLLQRGLVVRTFPASSQLADYIRITVRRPDENARLLAALKASLEAAAGP